MLVASSGCEEREQLEIRETSERDFYIVQSPLLLKMELSNSLEICSTETTMEKKELGVFLSLKFCG